MGLRFSYALKLVQADLNKMGRKNFRCVLKISFELLLGYFRADLASSPPKRSELRFKGLEAKMPKRNKSKQR